MIFFQFDYWVQLRRWRRETRPLRNCGIRPDLHVPVLSKRPYQWICFSDWATTRVLRHSLRWQSEAFWEGEPRIHPSSCLGQPYILDLWDFGNLKGEDVWGLRRLFFYECYIYKSPTGNVMIVESWWDFTVFYNGSTLIRRINT
ncbi:hypothetical protein QAD02_009887 [Eretmocerus hayati]|uniref:Uncharacterized protein n=1 Tax=Eretmocerus hayati TaxID=131215 RepID=A0ACC2ND02_9HYME|nr:hypothetical protein QAD02_009887 [Eretmocerus hayati]